LAAADAVVTEYADYARSSQDKLDWNSYAATGILGKTMPRPRGGEDKPLLEAVAAFEGLAYGGGDPATLFAMAAQLWSVQHPIVRFGTPRQQDVFLQPLARGDLRAAHAASEPEAGSDILAMQTRAVRVTGGYLITGTKRYITNSPIADVALVFASTNPKRGSWGLSAFLVDLQVGGVSRSGNIAKVGLDAAQFGELHFDGCFVGTDALLGEEGMGNTIFSSSLDLERAFIMAPAVGAMRRELESSVAHVNTRKQQGRPIGSFQSVSNRVADMVVRLELSRLIMYRAAALRDSGFSTREYSPLVKLVISEAYVAFSLDAMKNKGAQAYVLGDSAGSCCRDAIGSLFYSGTSDVLRNMIAAYAGVNDAGHLN